jgi:DNA-binding MarR family transcriptional regulator
MVIRMKVELMERIYFLINSFNAESKQARDYGTGDLLHHSEVHLIVAMFNHKDANASELAHALGVTNGAVTQVANKLVKKGLIERYKEKGNKKDTFFRLTKQSETVYYGHERHHEEMHADAIKFMDSLNENDVKVIIALFDKLTEKMPPC